MNQWSSGKFSDIAEVIMGQSPPGESYNGTGLGVPLINGPTEFTDRYPVRQQWTTAPTKLCKAGDILFCVRGSSTGRMNIADDEYCIGRGVAAIRGKKDVSDTCFLEQQLQFIVSKLLKFTAGSTFPNIDRDSISNFPIFSPTLPEQKKIAEILSCWDRGIDQVSRLIQIHEQITNKIIEACFRDEFDWEQCSVSDLASDEPNSFKDGDWIESPHITSSGVRLVQTGNIGQGFFKNGNKKYISEGSFQMLKCKEVRPGDILICRLADPIGRCCILPDLHENKYITSVDVIIFRPKVTCDSTFLCAYLNRRRILEEAIALSGGSTRQRVSRTSYGAIQIGVPPKTYQLAVSAFYKNSVLKHAQLLNLKNSMNYQKQGLMQKLLTGEVKVKI